jgi:hypothetical protein
MLSRFFQESDHLLALYAGESLEELLDRITRLQMIEQTLHRHASTSENRLAAKNFRILRYNAAHAHQNTAWFWSPQNRCSSQHSKFTRRGFYFGNPFETRSRPRFLAATPRGFTLITRTATCSRQLP